MHSYFTDAEFSSSFQWVNVFLIALQRFGAFRRILKYFLILKSSQSTLNWFNFPYFLFYFFLPFIKCFQNSFTSKTFTREKQYWIIGFIICISQIWIESGLSETVSWNSYYIRVLVQLALCCNIIKRFLMS